jgi:hypothetical protein
MALQAAPTVRTLDVLAAAFAAAGQFDNAVITCRSAIDHLPAADRNTRGLLEHRLRLYEAHTGYDQPVTSR